MKTNSFMLKKIIFLLNLGLLLPLQVPAQSVANSETNLFFHTWFVPQELNYNAHSESFYYNHRRDVGELIPECFPAAQDTNGNWGEATDDMQLSVRFRRIEFVRGEPVVALVILRNVGAKPRKGWLEFKPHNEYEYLLWHGTNISVWKRPKPGMWEHSALPSATKPQTQRATTVPLNDLFDLHQLGEYTLQVKRLEMASTGSGFTNILSGKATFRIVQKLSPVEISATNAFFKHQEDVARRAKVIYR